MQMTISIDRVRGNRANPTRLGGLVLLATALVLAGCGGGDVADSRAAEAPAAGYPVSIENCGRTLTFENAPSEVLVAYQPLLETLIGLGVADRVIARGSSKARSLRRCRRGTRRSSKPFL